MPSSRDVVTLLGKRRVRCIVAAVWLGLGLPGFLATAKLKDELTDEVPPCKGTPSFEAKTALDKYFPVEPVNGALFVRSADNLPLFNFSPRSTCTVSYTPVTITDRTISVSISCANISAVGGGCATRSDWLAISQPLIADLGVALHDHLSPRDIKRVQEEFRFAFEAFAGSVLLSTSCPEASAGNLTQEWLGFLSSLNTSLASKLPHFQSSVASVASIPAERETVAANLPLLQKTGWQANVSVALPSGQFWALIKEQFVADERHTALVATTHTDPGGGKLLPMGKDAAQIAQALTEIAAGAPASLHVRALSLSLIGTAVFTGVDHTMDLSAMTVPLALLVLAAMVRNLRLVLITVLNLAACYGAATLIMLPVAKHYTTASTAPAMMVAVALAMSIDYSLFLLTRYQKEMRAQTEAGTGACAASPAAVAATLETSGRIVLVSGLTLLLCFLMMLSLPVAFIASMGVSAAITVVMAVLAALTLTPVMLLSFPSFFGSSRRWGLSCEGCCCCCCCRRSGSAPCTPPEPPRIVAGAGLLGSPTQPREKTSVWSTFGRGVQRFALGVVVLLLAVAVPVAVLSLPDFHHAIGFEPMMPVDAEVTKTLNMLQDSFGVGSVFPTSLLAIPVPGATASPEALERWLSDACEVLQEIAGTTAQGLAPGAPAFTAAAFSGPMIFAGQCSTFLQGPWSRVGGPHSATRVAISYAVDPFSTEGQQWLQSLRRAVNSPSASSVASWHILGSAAIEMDVANKTFGRLPLMISLMMVAVFVVIGSSTRSLVAPVRAVVCLAWMLAVTLGLAVFTFQEGMLSFLHWEQLDTRTSGAMSWMSPCMAISVLVGLGLDYDIFYSERVLEEWGRGHGEREAAVRSLAATANTISVAGLIMVVAFVALLLCTIPTLNEIAFMLVIGVVIDCLVATKVIIPCMMALLGRANFWPRKQPV